MTVSSTDQGLRQFTVMPFGLFNAPATLESSFPNSRSNGCTPHDSLFSNACICLHTKCNSYIIIIWTSGNTIGPTNLKPAVSEPCLTFHKPKTSFLPSSVRKWQYCWVSCYHMVWYQKFTNVQFNGIFVICKVRERESWLGNKGRSYSWKCSRKFFGGLDLLVVLDMVTFPSISFNGL